eukprot:3823139-Rhodomonas_salina.3
MMMPLMWPARLDDKRAAQRWSRTGQGRSRRSSNRMLFLQINPRVPTYTTFDNLVGTLQDVWVVEFGKDANYVVGHTSSYVQ